MIDVTDARWGKEDISIFVSEREREREIEKGGSLKIDELYRGKGRRLIDITDARWGKEDNSIFVSEREKERDRERG